VLSFIEFRGCGSSRRLLQSATAPVSHDSQEPCPGIFAIERIKKSKRAKIGILHRVLRIVLVTHQPAREIVGGIQVWHYGLFKSHQSVCVSHYYTIPVKRTKNSREYLRCRPGMHRRTAKKQ
jgi:hypothetical protein